MGSQGNKIIDVDIKKLLTMLNKALADEWLAYYQYWAGSKIAQGILREPVVAELEEHANEELEHANKLAERILQLGGIPLLNPDEWKKKANCEYAQPPKTGNTKTLLQQNIKGEQCAIEVYNKILKFVEGKDVKTYNLIAEILSDEVDHEDDLQQLLQELKTMK